MYLRYIIKQFKVTDNKYVDIYREKKYYREKRLIHTILGLFFIF